ncbi:heterokaryon incompatibility protein-domain-containing protein [Hypoxylon sp. FL1284]|nr:heterokaryon incompatibility protein-domain-containing protein [Hypoxylon sp. FL1284]
MFIYADRERRSTLAVTQNLYDALIALRYGDRVRTLWIDAICINQRDEKERRAHIPLMHSIYHQANRVLVWLGQESDDSNRAISKINDVGQQINVKCPPFSNQTLRWSIIKKAAKGSDVRVDDSNMLLPMTDEELATIVRLLSRPWFNRLWVRQEIHQANHILAQCGQSTVPWDYLRKVISVVCYLKHPDYYSSTWKALKKSLMWCTEKRGLSFCQLRIEFEGALCRDPKDRIYGTLGLLTDQTWARRISPNYSKTTTQVYQDVTRFYFQECRDLSILEQCQRGVEFDGHVFAPSWVPDWAMKPPVEKFLVHTRASSHIAPLTIRVVGGTGLRVAGVKVSDIHATRKLGIISSSPIDHVIKAIRKATRDVNLPDGTFNEPLVEVYARTLSCNDLAENYEPPAPAEARPSLEKIKQTLRQIHQDADPISHVDWGCIDHIKSWAIGRSLVLVWAGGRVLVGLVPLTARRGDAICVLLGSDIPMMLRPFTEGYDERLQTFVTRYTVVGGCYIEDISHGQAILGPLPPNIRAVRYWGHQPGFKNMDTGEVSGVDPRFGDLGINPPTLGDFQQWLRRDRWARLEVDAGKLKANIDVYVLE